VRRVDNTNTNANALAVYRKAAGGSEPADYTWTMGGATHVVGGIQSFTGVDTTTPVDVENGHITAAGLTHATPSVTTTVDDVMLVTAHTLSSSPTWTPPGGTTEAVDVNVGQSSGTVESRVTSNSDDAEEDVSDGSMYLGSTDLELIDESDGDGDQVVGMRFLNMTVPAGAIITNAYIEFETDELDSVTTNLTFRAEDADDPTTFQSGTNNITNRTTTTASVAWNSVPAWGTESEKHQTPDLSPIIQEVVDRGSWASGNAMVVIVTGSGERTAEAHEGESANAPLLHVEYTDVVAGQSIETSFALQVTAGATGAKTATATAGSDVGNTHILALAPGDPTAALTGTLADGAVEDALHAGGETLVITLTHDTWDATIGADNAKTTALIGGIDSAQSEVLGWDAVVKANMDFNDVTRTSDRVVTITLGVETAYAISATETITVTVPATALAGASPLVATPTFDITRFLIEERAAAAANATTGNLTITKPAGTAEGDVMIASVGVRPDTATITPPTGWTLVRRVDNTTANANTLAVYRKTAGASEPADYTWTMGSAANSVGGIQAFSGVDITSPVDVENGQTTASSLTHATPSVTTTETDAMLVTSHTYSSSATWTPPAGMTEAVDVQSGVGSGTVEVSTAASSDDAKEKLSDNNVALDNKDLDFVSTEEVGLRFPSMTIPADATITSAYIEFVASSYKTLATNVTFFAEDGDDPGAFTLTDGDITDRTKTTASVNWPSVPSWTADTTYQSVDVSAIIQEVVDRGGWASGNAMVVIVTTASGDRRFKTFDESAGEAPLLHVEYTDTGPGQSIEAGYTLQAAAGATGAKTATAAASADVGNTHILALTPKDFRGAALTGTLTGGVNEYDITTGGETLTITLTADNAVTDALIAGIDSAQAEATGWDAVVKANMDFNDVARTSDTVVTITLGVEAAYDITATETITVTVPATAVAGSDALVATPTFAIAPVTPFGFRKSITIDRTKVGTGTAPATLANYPLLYSVTDVDLKSTGNGGDVTSTSGYDILFRAVDDTTCGGTGPCTLDHEVEEYDPATGRLVAWVRLPSVNTNTAGSDTVLYIYYGNSAITASIEDADGVWDTNYKGVWHLEESPANGVAGHDDSSGNSNSGTPSGFAGDANGTTNATGKIGGADRFDGTDDFLDMGSDATLDDLGPLTVSAWINPDTTGEGSAGKVIAKYDTGTGRWFLEIDDTAPEVETFEFNKDHATTDLARVASNSTVSLTSWQQVVVTWDGTTTASNIHIYKNGAEVSYAVTTNGAGAENSDAGEPLIIGARADNGNAYDGYIDEVRVSNVVRTADWIKTAYNNTNAPGDIGAADFYTVGAEDPSPLTAVTLITFTATGYDRAVLLEWRTGYEVDNLGFRIYREQAGDRVQLTPSMVAGSGLLGERGVAVTDEQAYAWWDLAATQTTPGITYWLEDVDFDGTSTWHGPITPVDGGRLIDVGPPAPGESLRGDDSRSLDGLGQDGGTSRRLFFTGDDPFPTPAASNAGDTPLETQWNLAGLAAVKIGVRQSGWLRVPQAQLVAAGLDPDVNPRTLALFVDGVEQAIVVTGEADLRLDASDAIEFYGVGVDTAYTDTRIYWLVSGVGSGLRMGDAAQSGQPTVNRLTPSAPPEASPTAGPPTTTPSPRPAPPLATPPAPAGRRPSPATVNRRARSTVAPPWNPRRAPAVVPPADTNVAPAAAPESTPIPESTVDTAPVATTTTPTTIPTPTPATTAPAASLGATPAAAPVFTPRPKTGLAPGVESPPERSASAQTDPSLPSSSPPAPSQPATMGLPSAVGGWRVAPAPVSQATEPTGQTGQTQRTGRQNRPPAPDGGDRDARDRNALSQAQAASELAIETRLARSAGVPDAEIFEVTAAFDPDGDPRANRRVIETLRKARLTALGYDVTMPGDEYGRLQAIAARMTASGGGLTEGDVRWLRDRLAADPAYFDRLPRRGMTAPATSDVARPPNGFLPGLDADRASELEALVEPLIESAGSDGEGRGEGNDR